MSVVSLFMTAMSTEMWTARLETEFHGKYQVLMNEANQSIKSVVFFIVVALLTVDVYWK